LQLAKPKILTIHNARAVTGRNPDHTICSLFRQQKNEIILKALVQARYLKNTVAHAGRRIVRSNKSVKSRILSYNINFEQVKFYVRTCFRHRVFGGKINLKLCCYNKFTIPVFLLLLMFFTITPAQALTVQDVRIGLHPGNTRVVLELSEASPFRAFVLDNPWRLVVDMPTFGWQAGQISRPAGSLIKTIRQGALDPGISRVVIDLEEPVSLQKAFLIKKDGGKPDRLVIDFKQTSAAGFALEKGKSLGNLKAEGFRNETPPLVATVTPPLPNQQQTKQASTGMALPQKKPSESASPYSHAPQEKKYFIVIDAGHGGVDPGAIGANGVFEKHIALAMAKELKQILEDTGRYKVLLTRDRDVYLRLFQRVEIARSHSADLFISLHADSIGKGNVRGASIYTLSEKASDEQTARLADRENKADIIAGIDISHEDKQVADILIDIAMRDTMNQSKFFANTIIETMGHGGINILEKPHRSAGFAVLKAPDIPSVLIEMGFMSNKSEAQLLSEPSYRRKVARTIVQGIDAYFEKARRNNRI